MLLKKHIEKIKDALAKRQGKEKTENFMSINFATETVSTVKFVAFIATIFLVFGLILSVEYLKSSSTLKIRAAGTPIGSKVFCGGKQLCPDGRCEGEVWKECKGCESGKARAVMETVCGTYIRSECTLEGDVCE